MAKNNRFSINNTDYIVFRPKPGAVYYIPQADWNRLKNMIHKIVPNSSWYQIFAATFFGVAISAFFEWLGFKILISPPPWIFPTIYAIEVSSLILACAFYRLDKRYKIYTQVSSKDIVDEMDTIEKNLTKQKN